MLLKLRIITPYGEYFNGEAMMIKSIGTADGELGILPNHTPLIAPLIISKLVIQFSDDKINTFAISGGVLIIEKELTTIIANSIEAKEDIDLQRALSSKKRAEERLLKSDKIDIKRAQASLARALNRINIKQQN